MTQMEKIPPMFEGLPGEDVRKWLTTMRAELERRSVPRTEWVSTATIFLGNRVRQILEETKAAFEWDGQWESFTCVLESTFNGACCVPSRDVKNDCTAENIVQTESKRQIRNSVCSRS
jgi:hypothetical protein